MDSTDIGARKSRLRLRVRAARRAIGPEMREVASRQVAERVLELPEMQSVRAVLVYGASPEEIDTASLEEELRARGVRIAYPRVESRSRLALHWVDDRGQLVRGSFGLLEPSPEAASATPADIDAVIVPGVAFDAAGGRVGYGRGYYDALLSGACGGIPAIGVAFDEQVVDVVPCDDRDVRLPLLVTPTRTIRCSTRCP